MVLAGMFARALGIPWQVWWIDTKGDKADLAALRQWGFRNAASKADRSPESGGLPNALYFVVEPSTRGESLISIKDQAQEILSAAYTRQHVVVIVDEYTQVALNERTPGEALLNVFARGRSHNVGLIGLTQEPVFVPRQLISQASHICILSLTYTRDIEYAKKICPIYQPPIRLKDPYGFYWAWIDGSGEWTYYPNQAEWFSKLRVAQARLATGIPS